MNGSKIQWPVSKQVLVILLLPVIPTVLAGIWHPHTVHWNTQVWAPGEVLLEEVRSWPAVPLWIDARDETAFQAKTFPGALHLSINQWNDGLPAVLDRWPPGMRVVIFCASAQCDASHEVADGLRQLGIRPVYVLHGGWNSLRRVP